MESGEIASTDIYTNAAYVGYLSLNTRTDFAMHRFRHLLSGTHFFDTVLENPSPTVFKSRLNFDLFN